MTKRIDERAAILATRRQVLVAGAAGPALLLPTGPRVARAATGGYTFDCNKNAGFLPSSTAPKCVGYVTDFGGLGLPAPLLKDLQVYVPWPGPAAPAYPSIALGAARAGGGFSTAKVVGVIERLQWGGGIGDPIQIDFWVSQENAVQVKALQQAMLRTMAVSTLGYWIIDYDQQTKVWYEKAFPLTPANPGGLIGGGANPMLDVNLAGTPAAAGIDVMVYKISVGIVPAVNRATMLQFATNSSAKVSKQWGLLPMPAPPPRP